MAALDQLRAILTVRQSAHRNAIVLPNRHLLLPPLAHIRERRQRPLLVAASSGAGFGSASSGKGGGRGERRPPSDPSGTAQRLGQVQLDATRVLAALLEAHNAGQGQLQQALAERAAALTEEFFLLASTYLEMAKKEGNAQVAAQLEAVLRAAMLEKEKSLRPEIQLLNKLLRQPTPGERLPTLLAHRELLAPDSYFFQLLQRMLVDVEGQQPQQSKLLTQLKSIEREAREAGLQKA